MKNFQLKKRNKSILVKNDKLLKRIRVLEIKVNKLVIKIDHIILKMRYFNQKNIKNNLFQLKEDK